MQKHWMKNNPRPNYVWFLLGLAAHLYDPHWISVFYATHWDTRLSISCFKQGFGADLGSRLTVHTHSANAFLRASDMQGGIISEDALIQGDSAPPPACRVATLGAA